MQPKVQIENLEFCVLSEASQHGLLGLKTSEDQAIEKQQGVPDLPTDLALRGALLEILLASHN